MNYVIINADDIQKRIDDLENTDDFFSQGSFEKHKYLKQLLSNSIPLIPEIEKAVTEGMLIQRTINDKVKIPYYRIKNYVSQLKFDI